MPMIRVEMFAGRTKEQKRRFAEIVTASWVECCGGSAGSVQIVFQEVSRDDWATAGKLASDAAAVVPPVTPPSD